MYSKQSKKMLNICILEILREYSDEDHRLKQQDIIEYLRKDYNMECDRKTVKANILSLMEFGYEIECEEIVRRNKNGEEENITTDWYLVHDFDDTELKMLIDSVLFSKIIPVSNSKVLIEKIKGLSSNYFGMKVKNVCCLRELHRADNKQTLYNLNKIDEAIEKKRQISFVYCTYGTDKKLHSRRERRYLVNPYKLIASNGRYYLLCNYDKYDNYSYYRLDRMLDVKIEQTNIKPMSKVKGLENGINLPKHLAEHIYMFAGETVITKLRVDKGIISEIVDWFGKDFNVVSENDKSVDLLIKCSYKAMYLWAMQYGEYVEIISPKNLRNDIKNNIRTMAKKYGVNTDET